MVPIRQNLVSTSKYNIKCPHSMKPEGITVHNTANKASAENEINYLKFWLDNNSQLFFQLFALNLVMT